MKVFKAMTLITEEKLRHIAIVVSLAAIIVQIFLVWVNIGHPQYTDMLAYMNDAYLCIEQNEWYPIKSNVYEDYLWAYGLINCLIAEYYLLGTMYYHGFLNVLMNAGIVYSIYVIGRAVYNEKTSLWSVIAFSLLYCNISGVLLYGTEIPFLFFITSAYALFLTSNRLLNMVLVGVLFFLANSIRPLAILFIASLFVLYWLKEKNIKKSILVFCVYVACCLSYGLYNEKKIGYFTYQSETGGVNLIMGAFDESDGLTSTGAALLHSEKGKYNSQWARNKTFKEKEYIWKHDAIDWILQHPMNYISQTPKKIITLLADNSWTDRMFDGEGLYQSLRNPQRSSADKAKIIILLVLKNMSYYILLIMFLTSLYSNKRSLLSYKGVFVWLAVIGLGATCVFVVQSRYNYPFLFCIILWTCYSLNSTSDNQKIISSSR